MAHTVLLVDDESHVLTGLQRALHKAPYTFLSASTADEALALLRTQPVDVVISDQQMPGTLGTAFLGIVSREFPQTIRMLLTGQATREVVIQAIREGAVSHVLTKPCSGTALATLLHRVIPQHDLSAEARALLSTKAEESAQLAAWIRTYARSMHLQYPQDHESLGTHEALPLADLLSQLQRRASKTALLLSPRRRTLVPVTLNTVHETTLVIDLSGSGMLYGLGDRLLLCCAIPPQERYILETWIEALYYRRMALQCTPPRHTPGQGEQVVYRSA